MKPVYYPEVDETLHMEVLENGLTVAVLPRKGFSLKTAYFVTNFGSIHTEFTLDGVHHQVPAGIAHYLEHKLFDMPDGRDVSAEFAAMGAGVNAFTSYDVTAYYFFGTQRFYEGLRLLLEFVSTPYFTEESVEKERGIIDQEIGMNLDSPETMIFENLTQTMYEKHKIRVPILGTSESIRQITPENLHLCHRAFYTPANMMLCVVGDVEPEQVCSLAREVLGSHCASVGIKDDYPEESMTLSQKEVSQEMDITVPSVQLAFKCEPLGLGEEAIRQEMVAELACDLLFGETSPLYRQLYEAGIIDSSFGGGFETIDGCALLLCDCDTDQPEAVRNGIFAEVERLNQEGISEEAFLRIKRSSLGRRIRSLDSMDATCYRICAYHLSGFDYFRFPELYRTIEKQELLDFLTRVVRQERCCLSTIIPMKKEESDQ